MNKKIAILGVTGMAGHTIALYLKEQKYDVYGMSRSVKTSDKNERIDVTDFETLKNWLHKIEPDVIVNAIGLLQKTSEKRPDLAILVNSYLPQMLAVHYRSSKTKIIHLSTDCVFSGKTAPYSEDSSPDGETIYDRTKSLGEIVNDKDLTFRMSIIGPDTDPEGSGLLNWFLKQNGEISGFTKAIWNGITTIELAKAIDAAVRQDLTGLYHLTPNQNIDKYSLLCLMQKHFGKMNITIRPCADFAVDKTLLNNRTYFAYRIPDYDTMIKETAEWVEKHSKLYWFKKR